jgi:hypothetical protein
VKRNIKKIPEWLNPDEVTIDMAKHLIAYKQKISEQWLEKKMVISLKVTQVIMKLQKNQLLKD